MAFGIRKIWWMRQECLSLWLEGKDKVGGLKVVVRGIELCRD